jgi:hypothetical protein
MFFHLVSDTIVTGLSVCCYCSSHLTMKVDHEGFRALLVDTLTMLCRNGLIFQAEVRVQGLLGITVDGCDVFLVSMDEKVGYNSDEAFVSAGSLSSVMKPVGGQLRTDGICKTATFGQDQSAYSIENSHFDDTGTSTRYKAEQVATDSAGHPFSGSQRQKRMFKKKSSRQFKDRSVLVDSTCTTEDCGNDDLILIDSDGSDNDNCKREVIADDYQQADYYMQNELPAAAGMAGYYTTQTQNSQILESNIDPNCEQQVTDDLDYDLNAEEYTTNYTGKLESAEQPETSWSAGAGGRVGFNKKKRKASHFGTHGAPSWRRRHLQHHVSS